MPVSSGQICAAVLLGIVLPGLASASGQPDPSFGEDGALVIHADHAEPVGREHGADVRIDSAGRYVTVGTAFKTNDSNAMLGLVTRHFADGTPDPSLNGSGFRHLEWQGKPFGLRYVRQTGDGALIVAGAQLDELGFSVAPLICRLHDDGRFDEQFQDGGCRRLAVIRGNPGLQSDVLGFELLPDGRMLILGEPVEDAGNPRGFALVRLLPNGDDDPDFGDDSSCPNPAPRCGIAFSPAELLDVIQAEALALDAQERILVGADMNVGTFQLLTVLRYSSEGSLDLVFKVMNFDSLTGEPETRHLARDVHVTPDGGAVLVGELEIPSQPDRLAVARFLADGSADPGFGSAGRVTDMFDTLAEDNAIGGSTLQSDGKLLVVGDSRVSSRWRCHVLRLDARTGLRDIAFGHGGVSTPDTLNALSPKDCYASAVVSDAQTVLVAGTSQAETDIPVGMDSNPFLLRLERDALFRDGFDE